MLCHLVPILCTEHGGSHSVGKLVIDIVVLSLDHLSPRGSARSSLASRIRDCGALCRKYMHSIRVFWVGIPGLWAVS